MENIQELLEAIIFKNYKSPDYYLRLQLSNQIQMHSNGPIELIANLLRTKFPTEPEMILEYRLCNIARVTKTYFNKIVATLAKIERADDFVLKFNDKQFQMFCEEKIKNAGSVINWFFKIGIKTMLEEPNGYILVLPEYTEDMQELNNINFRVIRAEQIVYYEQDELIVVLESAGVYTLIDRNSIKEVTIEDNTGKRSKSKYTVTTLLEHNLGVMPVVQFGGLVYSAQEPIVYESFVSGVVPFWDQALIEYSDKQAGIKQHLFPEKWRYVSGTCPDCHGNGYHNIDGLGKTARATCATCSGSGNSAPTGMFSEVIIQSGSAFDADIPKPPIGYVNKDFSAIEYLDTDFKQNIYAGLAAINMEFLMERPLNQSGVSKEMDRQELNSFIFQVASHITHNILTPMFRLIASWYYYGMPNDPEASIPYIKTPVHYDYISTDSYESALTKAKQGKFSNYLTQAIERKYIEKQFENFFEEQTYLLLINKLDPLPAYTIDEKRALYKSKTISREDYVCSINIEQLIKDILYDRVKFYNFDYGKQKEILSEYTQKLIIEIDKESEDEEPNRISTALQGNAPAVPFGDVPDSESD
jgi:hypothetical protein